MLTSNRRLRFACFSLLLLAALTLDFGAGRSTYAQSSPPTWPAEWQADSAFDGVWSRVDGPLAAGSVARSWLWGPLPFAVANEPYDESSTGKRLVQYFDKARMEVNDPSVDRASPWFVTSGLLVYEMVTGKMQTGNNAFEQRKPADAPVAGDAASPDAPTYSAFAGLTAPADSAPGTPVNRRVDKAGLLSSYTPQSDLAQFDVASYDEVSKHNVPKVFTDWLNQTGTVLQGGRLAQGRLIDPLFVLGRPITEPYWANVTVGGKPTVVLVQLFERRALTYNPDNPPEWRVEMANVGRAYYDWRYGGAPPDPAMSAEVMSDGVVAHGWNWAANAIVSLEIDPATVGNPLAGPSIAQADTSGRFAFNLTYNQPLQNALQSGAKLRITAQSGQTTTALPLAGKPPTGKVHLEGTITLVETTQAGTRLVLTALDGKQWRLSLAAGANITSSEGSPATPNALDAGISAVIEGNSVQGIIVASNIRLMSASRTSARVSYEWSSDGSSIFVAGTGWPGERAVDFSTGSTNGPQTTFATLRSDSRSNLTGSIKPPSGLISQSADWLFATSTDKGGVVARIAVPAASLGSPGVPTAIQLYITGRQGVQVGGIGSYCTAGKCFPTGGVTLPIDTLTGSAGDVLGLRAQVGANPQFAHTATSLSAQLYAFPDASGLVGGSVFFVPKGTPIYTTGDLPGRPFSVMLPAKLVAGRYVLVVTVQWPDTGGKSNGTYGFVVQIP